MAKLTLKEAAQAVGGRLLQGSGAETVERYAIDSRAIAGGEMFFALQGAHHDGHEFLGDVFTRGAAAAVVSRPGVTAPADRTLLQAKDTTRALQDLAAALRKSRALSVVGITGSSGKTTTKELTAAVAATRFRTHKTPGNLNNTYGLPLAILGMPDT